MATQVATAVSPLHRFSVEDVMAMVEAGILDDKARVELVDGVLVDMSPTGPRHSFAVEWLNEHFVLAARGAFRVRIQDTFITGEYGFVEPDLMVIEPIWRDRTPEAALLVVEVSKTSRARDDQKVATYATAAVPEYWIVDVHRGELVVHREPTGAAYASVQRFVAGDVVTPLLDVPPVDVAILLAP